MMRQLKSLCTFAFQPCASPPCIPLQDDQPMWQVVLDHAVDGGMHALLDTGALLASSGTSNA